MGSPPVFVIEEGKLEIVIGPSPVGTVLLGDSRIITKSLGVSGYIL